MIGVQRLDGPIALSLCGPTPQDEERLVAQEITQALAQVAITKELVITRQQVLVLIEDVSINLALAHDGGVVKRRRAFITNACFYFQT